LVSKDKTRKLLLKERSKVISLIGIGLSVLATIIIWRLNAQYTPLGIISLIACILFLLFHSEGDINLISIPIRPLVGLGITLLLSFCTIASAIGTNERPLTYFVLATVLVLSVLPDILCSKPRPVIAVSKVLIVALTLRWSLFFTLPGIYLGSDPLANHHIYEEIAKYGLLNSNIAGYIGMPLHHLLVASLIKAGIETRTAMMLSVGMVEATSVIPIFLLGKDMLGYRVGLLASLLIAVDNLHVMWGWWIVAQSMGIGLFAWLLWSAMRVFHAGKWGWFILTVVIFIAILFSHYVSAFVSLITLAFLAVGYIVHKLLSHSKIKIMSAVLIPTLITLLLLCWFVEGHVQYLSYAVGVYNVNQSEQKSALNVEQYRVKAFDPIQFRTLDDGINPDNVKQLITSNVLAQVNRSGNYLYYGLAVLGLLCLLGKTKGSALAVCGIMMTATVFYLFFFKYSSPISVGRWFVFLDMILAVLAARGVTWLCSLFKKKSLQMITMVAIVLVLSFLMITNATASPDSPFYKAYTFQENWLTSQTQGK